jgi:predicted DNA-binding transcriptional regulator AlpA
MADKKQLVMAVKETLDKKELLKAVKESLADKRLLSEDDACLYLGIGRTLLFRQSKQGGIPSVKFFGCRRWDREELDALIEKIKVARDNGKN